MLLALKCVGAAEADRHSCKCRVVASLSIVIALRLYQLTLLTYRATVSVHHATSCIAADRRPIFVPKVTSVTIKVTRTLQHPKLLLGLRRDPVSLQLSQLRVVGRP